MNNDLKTLKEIEGRLLTEISKHPAFIKLEVIRKSISVFENGHNGNGHQSSFEAEEKGNIPTEYSSDLSWRVKILFALNRLGKAYISEIIDELKKLGETKDDDFLLKRVNVTVSNMKRNGVVGAKMVGKKGRYFIK